MILLMLLVISVPPLSTVSADQWNPGGPTHPYLTPKWAGYVAGGGMALVTADVLSDMLVKRFFMLEDPPSHQYAWQSNLF